MSERQYGGHFSFKDAATPAASGDVEAAWFEPDGTPTEPGLHPHYALWDHEGRKWDQSEHIGPRAESAGLDVERLARALRTGYLNGSWYGYESEAAAKVADEYARLAEDADDPRP